MVVRALQAMDELDAHLRQESRGILAIIDVVLGLNADVLQLYLQCRHSAQPMLIAHREVVQCRCYEINLQRVGFLEHCFRLA